MFAPTVFRKDGWFVIKGKLVDGTIVDVYRLSMKAPTFAKPPNVHDMYGNQRQTKYQMNISRANNRNRLSAYGHYLCRRWNKHFDNKKPIAVLKIYFMIERTPKPGAPIRLKKRMIWEHYCIMKYKSWAKSI